ncbi:MAG: OmpA family protein [Bryobacterales bacterium]|nr:OmpA family protein [Bryobacterales bacterium]
MLLTLVAAGCGLRNGRFAEPPPTPEAAGLAPAPNWVAELVAREARDVHFPFGSGVLDAVGRDALVRIIPGLKEIFLGFPDLVIVIEGHCDDRGSTEYNLRLGKQRADAARGLLVQQGIPALRLRAVSLGDTRPQCFTRDEECRRINRRVHLRAAQRKGAPHP